MIREVLNEEWEHGMAEVAEGRGKGKKRSRVKVTRTFGRVERDGVKQMRNHFDHGGY